MGGPDPALAAVRLAVRRSLGELPGCGLVLVALSGGPDSLALAAATAHEAPRSGRGAGAVTIDHGLQDGSAERARMVAERARRLGLDPVESVAVRVERAGGPEAAARNARYAALDAVAERTGAAAVLLGHTLDDQAETVLLGLARGSGARSLAGMAPVAGRYRRPLLGVERAVTRAACAAAGVRAWDDPHNVDAAFARARVRAVALPALGEALGPGIPAALARTAALLREDADALDAWAAQEVRRLDDATTGLDVAALAVLPGAVRTRVLRAVARAAGCPAGALTAAHVSALDALVTAWRGQGPVSLPGAMTGVRVADRLRIL